MGLVLIWQLFKIATRYLPLRMASNVALLFPIVRYIGHAKQVEVSGREGLHCVVMSHIISVLMNALTEVKTQGSETNFLPS